MVLDLFFSPERPFAFTLNLVILTLTLVAISRAVHVILVAMRDERDAIVKVSRVQPPTREGVVAAVASSSTNVESRVQDLAAFHRSKHEVDAASLTGLTTAAFRTQLASADGIGRSLVTLGLFGTLWGLGSAVTHLAGTISSNTMTARALTSAILGTLGGLQTAFGTTLAGLVGALLVGLMVGLARSRQEAVLRETERIMSTTLVPLFDTSQESSLADAAKALEAMQRRVADDMLAIISKLEAEGTALRNRLEEDFDRLENAFHLRADQLVQATGKALESTLSIIGERAEGEPTLAEYIRTVRATVNELQASVHAASSLIPQLETRLLEAVERQKAGLEDVFSRHEQAMEPLLYRQAESIEMLAGVAKQNVESAGTLTETLAQFSKELDSARTRWADLDEKIVEIGRSCQQGIHNGLSAVVTELFEGRQDETAERERIARHLATFDTELRSHLERLQEERNRVLAQMTELVEVTRDTVRAAVLEVGERLGEREDANGRELTLAVENLARELRGLVGPAHQPSGPDAHGGPLRRGRLPWDRLGVASSEVTAPIPTEPGD